MAKNPVPPEWKVTLPRPDWPVRDDGTRIPGRPTDLTDDRASKIIMALRLGAHQGPAAAWAGVAPETMSRWMHRTGEPYESFQQKVRESEAWAEVKAAGIVTGSKDAKDAISFLERRFPKRWARVPSVSVNQNVTVMDLGAMLDRIEQRRLEARNGQAPHDPRPPLVLDAHAEDVTEELQEEQSRPKREPVH